MNTEQWKAFRQERINKMRSVQAPAQQAASNKEKTVSNNNSSKQQHQQAAKKTACKRKQLKIHPEKKVVLEKKSQKAAEKPAPGANVNTITFSSVIYGTAPVTPQPFYAPPQFYAPPMAQHNFGTAPGIPQPFYAPSQFYSPPMGQHSYASPAPQHPQHCECTFCRH